ncbi:MAG: radical SAM protein [Sporichthyaceae bacterium]|nr:radical SAM protein [Sporichthyaceae bacterium]
MVIVDLVERLGAVAEGDTVTVSLAEPDDLATVRAWCLRSGNTLVRGDPTAAVVRRGRAPDPVLELAATRRPGTRLWMYTNFDCNLACDYCCVRSSPQADRRAFGADRISRLAQEAAAAGVSELLLTGGEPFLLPDLGQIVAACTAVLPTTLLTNGMLFRGRRLELLRDMPRDRLRLQISLDSATPDRHDLHRGPGSWAKALGGIRVAIAEGFTVRVAATLVRADAAERAELRGFLDGLGIPREHQILRPVAYRGVATEGGAAAGGVAGPRGDRDRRRGVLAPGRSRRR